MAEAPSSPCLTSDEVQKCTEVTAEIRRGSRESIPGPSVNIQATKNIVLNAYQKYKKWKAGVLVKKEGEGPRTEGPSSVKMLSRLWLFLRIEVLAWRCRESKISKDSLPSEMRKLDQLDLIQTYAVNEMEIKQHLMSSENSNGESPEASTPVEEVMECLGQFMRHYYEFWTCPNEDKPNDEGYYTVTTPDQECFLLLQETKEIFEEEISPSSSEDDGDYFSFTC